jgi:hypothetical protein
MVEDLIKNTKQEKYLGWNLPSMFSGGRTILTLSPVFFCRSRGSKLLDPILDSAVFRNLSISLNVKMTPEYLLRWYHRVVIFAKRLCRQHMFTKPCP